MTTTCFLWNQLSIHFLEHPNHFMVYVCYIILFAVPGIYFIFMPRKILLPPPLFFFLLELVSGFKASFGWHKFAYTPCFAYWNTPVNWDYLMLETYIFHLINVWCYPNGICGNISDFIPVNIQTKVTKALPDSESNS